MEKHSYSDVRSSTISSKYQPIKAKDLRSSGCNYNFSNGDDKSDRGSIRSGGNKNSNN